MTMSGTGSTRITTSDDLGRLIRDTRKRLGLTQPQLAAASGTGVRFIVDLERGKETARLGKALHVLKMLGITLLARG